MSQAASRTRSVVLLAEDDEPTRRILARELGKYCDVVAVEDGQAGVVAARAQRFDLVVTDFSMPGLDGIAMTQAVRRLPGMEAIPVVLLTSSTDKHVDLDALRLGARSILHKPISLTALGDIVRRALARA